jgi:hypothetical protein
VAAAVWDEIETDCIQVVQSMISFKNRKVSYIRRQVNRELVQATHFYASHQVIDYFSPCIDTIIMNEMH